MAKELYIIDDYVRIYAARCAPMRQQLTSPTLKGSLVVCT